MVDANTICSLSLMVAAGDVAARKSLANAAREDWGTVSVALDDANEAAKEADASYQAYVEADDDLDGEHVVAYSIAADETRDAVRQVAIKFDIPRTWIATDETGSVTSDLGICTLVAAREAAHDWAAAGDYGQGEKTVYLTYRIRCEETGEEHDVNITLQPEEPECSADEHDWQSPHEILGGLKENPGVWGHGGGVIIREVCMHCGCERETDTWAQDRSNGRQGLRSVTYEAGKYADEIEAMRDDARADYDV